MRTVRTTMQPDKEIEVGEADYLDLQRQGLLVEDAASTVPPATAASANPAKKTSTGAAGSKETDQ